MFSKLNEFLETIETNLATFEKNQLSNNADWVGTTACRNIEPCAKLRHRCWAGEEVANFQSAVFSWQSVVGTALPYPCQKRKGAN
jgi:hypothetical protein